MIKRHVWRLVAYGVMGMLPCLLLLQALAQPAPAASWPYRNARLPVDKRVNDLLGRMTTEEKIGQMLQLCASSITLNGTKELDLDSAKIRTYIRNNHVGSFLSGTGSAERWVRFTTQMQRMAVEETRLGIPIIFGIDHVHGANYVNEGTMFPHQLLLSCSFDTGLVSRVAGVAARETASLGMPWNFAPVLDVARNPFWPRHYETYGEDPLLCGALGAAFVRSYQHPEAYHPYRLSACAKHFVGYGDPRSGWDRAPSEIAPQALQEFFLPPFKMAFEAGVKTLMVNSGELNGEPVHGSRWLLTDILRKQMGFEGVVLTDIKDIMKMVTMHRAATDEKAATWRAMDAGIDMHMACDAVSFSAIMQQLLAERKISMARVDSSVRRILRLKFELGLFDHPYGTAAQLSDIGQAGHRNMALEAAEQSIVLLKNERNLLPLNRQQRILVAGFAADAKKPLTGPWTLEWQGAEESRQPAQMLTLAAALRQSFGNNNVMALPTPDTIAATHLQALQEQAAQADVIVLTVGERPYSEFKGNDVSMDLEASQQQLVDAACATGKPVVLVLIAGRPRVIRQVEPRVAAILFAGYPGEGGGEALANILKGTVNPSGRLSFSYPLDQAHWVPYYHKPAETAHLAAGQPLWQYPFGHGLSYTSFKYESLVISNDSISRVGKPLELRVTVTNTGSLPGMETVMLFGTDEVGWITRPVKQLKGFARVELQPGEKKVVHFRLKAEDLMYPDANGRLVWEQGAVLLKVGGQQARVTCL